MESSRFLMNYLPVWRYVLGVPIKVRSVSHSALVIHCATQDRPRVSVSGFDK